MKTNPSDLHEACSLLIYEKLKDIKLPLGIDFFIQDYDGNFSYLITFIINNNVKVSRTRLVSLNEDKTRLVLQLIEDCLYVLKLTIVNVITYNDKSAIDQETLKKYW